MIHGTCVYNWLHIEKGVPQVYIGPFQFWFEVSALLLSLTPPQSNSTKHLPNHLWASFYWNHTTKAISFHQKRNQGLACSRCPGSKEEERLWLESNLASFNPLQQCLKVLELSLNCQLDALGELVLFWWRQKSHILFAAFQQPCLTNFVVVSCIAKMLLSLFSVK